MTENETKQPQRPTEVLKDPVKSLDLQYGYYEDGEEEEEEKEGSDWLKGLIEYIKSRKQAQLQQVAE